MSAGAGVEDEEVGGEDLQELQMGTRRRRGRLERTKNMASGSSILLIFTSAFHQLSLRPSTAPNH